MKRTLTLVYLALFFISLQAEALRLFVWRPTPAYPAIVIGVRASETPEQAARRYLQDLNSDPELSALVRRKSIPKLPLVGFEPMTAAGSASRVLIITNSPNHLNPGDISIRPFLSAWKEFGVDAYILPVAADAGMENQSAEFIDLLNATFPSFIAMGGNDIDRRVFGEKNIHSYHVNYRRDVFEAALLLKKITTITAGTHAGDRLLGICRGAQLSAKLMGHYLGNDIACEIPGAIDHGAGLEGAERLISDEPHHPVDIFATKNSLLKGFLPGFDQILTNTFHHQYVQLRDGAGLPLQLAARSSLDGVNEAFESPEGHILLLQFHPEVMRLSTNAQLRANGEKLMKNISAFLTPSASCQKILFPNR